MKVHEGVELLRKELLKQMSTTTSLEGKTSEDAIESKEDDDTSISSSRMLNGNFTSKNLWLPGKDQMIKVILESHLKPKPYHATGCEFEEDLWLRPIPEIVSTLEESLKRHKELLTSSQGTKGLYFLFPRLPKDEKIRTELIDGLTKAFGKGTLSKEFKESGSPFSVFAKSNIDYIFGFEI